MDIRHIANIHSGQDGAIFGDYLFLFNAKGVGRVYDLRQIKALFTDSEEISELSPVSEFSLDRADEIVPHSNAVFFGSEFYAEGDEFPLLYSNIYNNYAKSNKLCGVCCVYRLQREGMQFSTTLVQLVEIGFTDDREYWRSAGDVSDVRPFGNFAADVKANTYYAFVMRDADKTTRYFAFALPRVTDGIVDETFGVRRVILTVDDIKDHFDTPYHNYIQGACVHDGRVYSVEGFSNEKIRPVLRVIDPGKRKQVFFFDFYGAGLEIEPECINFYNGKCIYVDGKGHVFELIFGEDELS